MYRNYIDQLVSTLDITPNVAMIELRVMLEQAVEKRVTLLPEELSEDQSKKMQRLIARRLDGEPIAYLTGVKEFYGMDFRVSPHCLIPRPETEQLIDIALDLIRHQRSQTGDGRIRFLDLGTGCGNLIISLATALLKIDIPAIFHAVDSSPEALLLARENAATHNVAIDFAQSHWFDAFTDRSVYFNGIVANPPYLSDCEYSRERMLHHEPRESLVSDEGGLRDLRLIITAAPRYLAHGGWLLLEHGYHQADVCRQMLAEAGFAHIETYRDLSDHPRNTVGFVPHA